MPHRKIVDKDQCVWDVWEVVPSTVASKVEERSVHPRISSRRGPRKILLPKALQNGWLAFQCEDERRRISPIPAGWETMTDDELIRLLERAGRVEKARKPS